jgi:gamma-D-glutamyl-L-lysine dipeptidyl-peptidase
MNYGISGLSLIPVRKEPSERSEMVTQILYGEHFEILSYLPGWQCVKLSFDGYEGWIDQKMTTNLSPRMFNKLQKKSYAVTTDIFSLVPVSKDQNLMLVAGSSLPQWRPNLRQFSLDDDPHIMTGNVSFRKHKNIRQFMISQAMKYFNAPYLWGGRTPFGIDCSGFTQIIYKTAGIPIPRDAAQQVHMGTYLSFVEETLPGDLAFFDDDDGRIVHVGMLWQRNKIIHASGKVRIDNVDQFGIFNIDTKRYTHRMRLMKRLIP